MTSPSTLGVAKATETYRLEVFLSLIILTDAGDALAAAQKTSRSAVRAGVEDEVARCNGKT